MRKGNEFERQLSGGDARSLGRAEKVVEMVLSDPRKVSHLFQCLFSTDEIVRMRAGDALEKVCRAQPAVVQPFTERLFSEVSRIKQPSIQWHLAQMLAELPLNNSDKSRAVKLLKKNLHESDDWIVTNLTIESLGKFARENEALRAELRRILPRYLASRHKSVVSRVKKLLKELGKINQS